MDRTDVERWVSGYVRAWRTAGIAALAELFRDDVSYSPSPWARPVVGLEALATFWEDQRDGADEQFEASYEVVAVDDQVVVVRVFVEYGDAGAGQWRDLWVIKFDDSGRCAAFEEWPFAPDQPDGHERVD